MRIHYIAAIALSAAVECVTLDDLRSEVNRRPLGTVERIGQSTARLIVNPSVLNVTVGQEGYELTSHGEPVDVGGVPLKQALCKSGTLFSYNDDVTKWCQKQALKKSRSEHDSGDIDILSERFVSFEIWSPFLDPALDAPSISGTAPSKQFIAGLCRLLFHPKSSPDLKTRDFVRIERNSYLSLVNGTGESNGKLKAALQNLKTALGDTVGIPREPQCFEISTESNPRGWVFSYGANYRSVSEHNCESFITREVWSCSGKLGLAQWLRQWIGALIAVLTKMANRLVVL